MSAKVSLYEQYRPRDWEHVIGQDRAKAKVAVLRRRGLAGRAYVLSGPSGTGKTTMAYLIACEVADDAYIMELDATELTPAALAEWEYASHLGAPGKGGRAYVCNEFHGLRRDTVRQLLVTLERIPPHVCWLFTSTLDGLSLFGDEQEDAHPLLSRCIDLRLTSQGLAPAGAPVLKAIPEKEGLDGQPVHRYQRLINDCKGNLRAALQRIEEGVMLA